MSHSEMSTLAALREAEAGCTRCPLYRDASQVVPGEGPSRAKVMFVGEQPGNDEDLAGRPFVGPAGRVLDRAILEAGLDRTTIFVTNAVKHFKFDRRGKLRLHKKPSISETKACRPWLEAEVAVLRPAILVCLGATAAMSVFGRDYRVTKERGQFVEHPLAPLATSTVHPSAILRAPDAEQRHAEYEMFLADLKKVRGFMETPQRVHSHGL